MVRITNNKLGSILPHISIKKLRNLEKFEPDNFSENILVYLIKQDFLDKETETLLNFLRTL